MLRILCLATILCLSQAQEYEYTVTTVDLDAVNTDSTSPRIVGGTATTIERYPYTVQIAQSGQLFCGGLLITQRHVLTAAHCFVNNEGQVTNPRIISIRAGTTNRNTGGQTRQVSAIIVNENYNRITFDNDVAVLLLASAVTLGATVGRAVLPVQGATMPYNTPVVALGWGATSEGGPLADVLQEVVVYKVNATECARRYAWLAAQENLPFVVTSNMICAGLLDVGGADACQGDSGGPLALQANTTIVVGVTSWGHGCARAMFPGVSARVSNFTDWIQTTVQRYNSAPSLGLPGIVLLASLLASLTVFKDV